MTRYISKIKQPLVSVILPTYNRAFLLPRSINSVLNQTYKNLELIVVDDNSTDNTKEIVKGLKDKRIKYVQHKNNKGAAAARNTGINLSKGEYIAFQDSDDEWLPEKLEKQMKVFENLSPKYGVVYCGYWRIKNNNKRYLPFSNLSHTSGYIHNDILMTSFVSMVTVISRKGCFLKSGIFDCNLSRIVDWELFIRISKNYHFKYINVPLVNVYCQSTSSISKNNSAFIKSMEIILEKHKLIFQKNQKALGKRTAMLADAYARSGNSIAAKKLFKKAIKLNVKFRYLFPAIFLNIFGIKIYKKLFDRIVPYA